MFNLAAVIEIDESYYRFYQSDEILNELEKLGEKISTPPKLSFQIEIFTENNFQKYPFPRSHYFFSLDGYMPPCCVKPFPKELNFGNIAKIKAVDTLNSDNYNEFRIL